MIPCNAGFISNSGTALGPCHKPQECGQQTFHRVRRTAFVGGCQLGRKRPDEDPNAYRSVGCTVILSQGRTTKLQVTAD